MAEPHPLYRSKNRVFFGICGSIAEYLGIDTALVRLITVILTIMGCGIPIIIYLVAILLVPKRPAGVSTNPYIDVSPAYESQTGDGRKISFVRLLVLIVLTVAAAFGILGFVVGMLLGAWQLDLQVFIGFFGAMSVVGFIWTTILPLSILIAALIFLIIAHKKLRRSSGNKKISGVCGGIAIYLKADPLVVRVVTLVAGLICGYAVVPIYILFWIILPLDIKNYNTWA